MNIKIKKPIILIIEDDETNLMILTKVLTNAQYDVVSGMTGMDGLRRLTEHEEVKVVLLDWMLPEMDGMEVLRRIRSVRKYDKVHVIMQTANDSVKDVKEAISKGADDYLVKPVDPQILVSKVVKALRIPRQPRKTS